MTGFIPPHSGYRGLLSYRKAEIIYDITHQFCRRFLRKPDRTIDQMIQAARSGKQNIVEGSAASGTSTEMEIKLLGVARASLEELLNDYQDFLRVRDLKLWPKDSKEALYVRRLGHKSHTSDESYETYREFVESRPAETVANIAICLIHQANYLLDRQIAALEQGFIQGGGYSEQLATERLRRRRQDRADRSDPTDRSDPSDRTDLKPPPCPKCGSLMALRTAKAGKTPGSQFWGCTRYPDCKGLAPL